MAPVPSGPGHHPHNQLYAPIKKPTPYSEPTPDTTPDPDITQPSLAQSLRTAASHYRLAASSFLTRDHQTVIDSLEGAWGCLPGVGVEWVDVDEEGVGVSRWLGKVVREVKEERGKAKGKGKASPSAGFLDGVEVEVGSKVHGRDAKREKELDLSAEMRRKVLILRTTFIVTVYSSYNATSGGTNPSTGSIPDVVKPYLDLSPDSLLTSLYDFLISTSIPNPPPTQPRPPQSLFPTPTATTDLPLPSPSTLNLHPSLLVALTLGGIKIGALRAAKAVAEAFTGSLGMNEKGELVWEVLEREEEGRVQEGNEDGENGGDLTASSSMIISTSSSAKASAPTSPTKSLHSSYHQLFSIYTLQVLPRLGDWQFSEEVIKMAGIEDGGWLTSTSVQNLLTSLHETKASHLQSLENAKRRAEETARRHSSSLAKKQAAAAEELRRKEETATRRGKASRGTKGSKGKEREVDRDRERGVMSNTEDEGGISSSSKSSPSKRGSTQPQSQSQSQSRSGSGSKGKDRDRTKSPQPSAANALTTTTTTTTRSKKGYASMRQALSKFITSDPSNTSTSVQLRPSSLQLLPLLRRWFSNPSTRLVSITLLLFAFLSVLRRRMKVLGGGGVGVGFGEVVRRVVEKVQDTVRMGTRVTYL